VSTLSVPTVEEVIERLAAVSGEAEREERIAAALGVEPAALHELRAEIEGRRDFAFHLQRRLGLTLSQRGQATVTRTPALGHWSKTNQVASLLDNAISGLDTRVVLISSRRQPEHALLTGAASGNWLVLACPTEPGTERVSIGGFRLAATALAEAPEGYSEIVSGRSVVGWLSPDGHVLRLRFHPVLSAQGRFTTSRAGERRELLRWLVELALRAQPSGIRRQEQDTSEWQAALALVESIDSTLTSSAAHLEQLHQRATVEQRNASRRVEQLTDQLIQAIRDEDEASRRVQEVVPLLRSERTASLSAAATALSAAKAQPRIASATLANGALRIVTQEGLTVDLALAPRRGIAPCRLISGETPLGIIGGSINLGEAFLPLLNALVAGNFAAAISILLGHLQQAS
jgi:hypothetical protein